MKRIAMKARKKYSLTATIYNKRGHVISRGENSYWKTHPMQVKTAKEVGREDAIFLHAEIAALVRLKDWSKAHRIKIERYAEDGTPLLAKPCQICERALEKAGIQIIEHT
jgi:deoxycytidylate deaminase